MQKFVMMIIMIISAADVSAQTDDEYRMEIGAGIGFCGYLGDFNDNLTKNLKPMTSLILRRNFNPYMGLRLSAGYGKLEGSSKNLKTYYPDYAEKYYEFDNSLIDISLTYEYNFWPYGTGFDYRGTKKITPFVFGGIGATYVNGDSENFFTANIPLGLGFKYKIGERLNLTMEWAMHFSLSDKLDGIKDPYGIKSSGLFKNTDSYSVLQFVITYSFMPRCSTCNKEY